MRMLQIGAVLNIIRMCQICFTVLRAKKHLIAYSPFACLPVGR